MLVKESINTVTKEYAFPDPTEFAYKVIYTDGTWFSVPHSTQNVDYQVILEWVADGNTITDEGGE